MVPSRSHILIRVINKCEGPQYKTNGKMLCSYVLMYRLLSSR